MLRTTVGVSFLVLFGVLSACSSKATDGNGAGGNGTAVTGGTGGSGTGTGGSGTGGNASAVGGSNVGRAGATSTAGSGNGLCPGETVTCVDDAQATVCNPQTGDVKTVNCVENSAALGITSTKCSVAADGQGCDIADFKDAACLAGAEAYQFCANATDADFLDVYIGCFQDNMGAHALVTCLGDYVSETMTADADCQNAADACLGAGGAGPDAGGGAGGAP
jgi:hypothetical protein